MGIDVAAGVAVTGAADGVRPPEPFVSGPGAYLRGLTEPVDGLVLAVPEQWFDTPGAARREALYGELAGDLGMPLRQFVPRAVAAAASLDQSSGRHLVCRLEADGVVAAVCGVRWQSVTLSSGVEWRTVGAGSPVTSPREPENPQEARRAALLLSRARVQARYRAAPLWLPQEMTAGAVLDAFAPVEQALRSALSPILAGPTASEGVSQILLGGGLRRHPLAGSAVQEAATGAPVRVLEEHAAALGALRVARGSVQAPETARHRLSLRVHRVHQGLLTEADLPLALPGGPVALAVRESGEEASSTSVRDDAHDVTVDVPDGHRPDVRIRLGDTEIRVPCPALRPGRYRLGLHSAGSGPGVLALRPKDGGETVLLPLNGPAGARTGDTG
ncbi:hypothetical protein [Streptomyces chrestomyceticus]|uniref:hypothetical protein n=1 Tax=Streptomyces chrestomyceticus TaxID=68185 RepID=UPI000F620DBC|nr:hypothetical protein [Streptomyces chrestomyceticus]